MNSEEQREYEERMGSPEMEYLQYQTEHPEMHEGQREEDLAQEIQNLYFDAGARVDIHTWNRTKSILAKAKAEALKGSATRSEVARLRLAEYQRGYEAAERDALEVVSREKDTWARESIGWRAVDSVEKTLIILQESDKQTNV